MKTEVGTGYADYRLGRLRLTRNYGHVGDRHWRFAEAALRYNWRVAIERQQGWVLTVRAGRFTLELVG